MSWLVDSSTHETHKPKGRAKLYLALFLTIVATFHDYHHLSPCAII